MQQVLLEMNSTPAEVLLCKGITLNGLPGKNKSKQYEQKLKCVTILSLLISLCSIVGGCH